MRPQVVREGGMWSWFTPRRATLLAAALLAAALALLAPDLTSSTELVRLRNALSLGPELQPGDTAWQPPAWPADFKTRTLTPDPYFIAVAKRLQLAALPDDDARVHAISAHLLGSAPQLKGGAVLSGLHGTYEAITQQGLGYCGDFVEIYTAIANAAGMSVRPWAFSFDGFGGHGHIWLESWNHERQRWQLVDIFQNYEYVLADGVPLSAMELRAALLANDPALRLRPLDPAGRPGWAVESKAWDYLRRGLDGWYALWGNNVMSRDQNLVLRFASRLSLSVESTLSAVLGLQPQVRLLPTAGNAAERETMHLLQWRVWLAGGLMTAAILVLLVPLLRRGLAAGPLPAGRDHGGMPRVCIVGPLPPPSGGMANQCEQLLRLLRDEGASVELVRTNADYRPAWVGHVPVLRALARLLPYLLQLWRAAGRCEVFHVLANSGWAWHLFAAPAIAIARWRGTHVIVNYRGGEADSFFAKAPRHVLRMLGSVTMRVVPSGFLVRVFHRHGLDAEIVPNIIDLSRFSPVPPRDFGDAPHLIVTRNLEPIYDIPTALQVLVEVRRSYAHARLTVAGSGPELERLQGLAQQLGVQDAVSFSGRIDNAAIPALYAQADCVLNPSTADNMPISILEAFASGVPVVSTDAGGIPDVVEHGVSGLLAPVGDAQALARGILQVLGDRALAARLCSAGLAEAARYDWSGVRALWFDAYRRAAGHARLQEAA